jgi:hypothetical protein
MKRLVYVVQDDTADYIDKDGRRTADPGEALEFETPEEAAAAREFITDQVLVREVEESDDKESD